MNFQDIPIAEDATHKKVIALILLKEPRKRTKAERRWGDERRVGKE